MDTSSLDTSYGYVPAGDITLVNPHANAMKNLLSEANSCESKRLAALRRIKEQSAEYVEALGGLSDEEIRKIGYFAQGTGSKYTFRNQKYLILYQFDVYVDNLEFESYDAPCLGEDALFGLTLFTITLDGRPTPCLMAICLHKALAEDFQVGTGFAPDVVFYCREDVHRAVLRALRERIPGHNVKSEED